MKLHTPWISSSLFDSVFILLPSFISLVIVMLLPDYFHDGAEVSILWWLVLILLIDVSHVYSTLFRTYFDKDTFTEHRSFLISLPFFSWIGAVIIFSIDPMFFWRVLAYVAVFHFIRQQYGFMRIYSRNEQSPEWMALIDKTAIYTATIYPVLYWHISAPRNFNWFVQDDFYYFKSDWLYYPALGFYLLTMLVYLTKEAWLIIKERAFNIPRNLLITGTFLTWYFGIVYFNGDLTFTLLNVVSHGIPYMALVYAFSRKKYNQKPAGVRSWKEKIFIGCGGLFFLLTVFVLAYLEEGLWDAMVWQDHKPLFQVFSWMPPVSDKALQAIVIPLLALPQITHYVIDGYIWKIKKDKFRWREVVLEKF